MSDLIERLRLIARDRDAVIVHIVDDDPRLIARRTLEEAADELSRLQSLSDQNRLTGGWRAVPEGQTDEMIRASLATDLPASFREYLRHPANGELAAKDVELRIKQERKRWTNILAASPPPPLPGGGEKR